MNLAEQGPKKKALLTLLRDGCHRTCDYDEAEGGLIDHCTQCCKQITRMAYELLVENYVGIDPRQVK